VGESDAGAGEVVAPPDGVVFVVDDLAGAAVPDVAGVVDDDEGGVRLMAQHGR
jgi:hypothetical protein